MHEELSREDQPGHRHYEHQLWQIRRCGIQKVKTGSERNICVVIKEKKKKKKKEPGALFVVIACFFCAGCALFFFFLFFFFCVCGGFSPQGSSFFFFVCVCVCTRWSVWRFVSSLLYLCVRSFFPHIHTDRHPLWRRLWCFFFFLCSVEVTLTWA